MTNEALPQALPLGAGTDLPALKPALSWFAHLGRRSPGMECGRKLLESSDHWVVYATAEMRVRVSKPEALIVAGHHRKVANHYLCVMLIELWPDKPRDAGSDWH